MKLTSLRDGVLLFSMLVFMSACALLPCDVPEKVEPVVDIPAPMPEPEPEPEPDPEPEPPPPYREVVGQQGGNYLVLPGEGGGDLPLTFNFDFDKSDLSSSDFSVFNQYAEFLVQNRDFSVTIEGHCDERGTREYNLALGERRAQAVADYLIGAGVRSSQITTVSFGEEVPVDAASNEAAWAKNRRAVVKVKSN
ncbi:MAG: peptidoglycan-associated lipoprotein Pal [Gammaproteobacteria bacterium]|nr:peptidoglycan-associated lipoprotein Pal [Gammaproteobacteria bacterium]